MGTCGRCGTQRDGTSVFCPGCGAVQAPAQPVAAQYPEPQYPAPQYPAARYAPAQYAPTGAAGWGAPPAWTGQLSSAPQPSAPVPPQRPRDPKLLLLVLGTLGVVVLAGVVAVLLLSRHGRPASAASATPAPAAGTAPRGAAGSAAGHVTVTPEARPAADAVPLPLVAVGSDCSYPASVDGSGQPVTYEPPKAVDADPSTAWRCPGAGGHTIELAPGEAGYVTDLGLVPGYAKVDPATGVDRFLDNHTVTRVTWRIRQGGQVFTLVQDITDPTPQLAWVHLSSPLAVDGLTLTVTGTGNPGARQDSTPISTIAVRGGLGPLGG